MEDSGYWEVQLYCTAWWLQVNRAVLIGLCADDDEHEDDFFAQSGIAQPCAAQPYVADESNGICVLPDSFLFKTCTVLLLTNPADLCFTD